MHSDFLDVFKDNVLSKQGALKIKGVPIDLSKVTVPAFITGGTTDHITPWEACYRSTQILGGKSTYVLSTAGHIQSVINPPTSSKRKFLTNPDTPPSAHKIGPGGYALAGLRGVALFVWIFGLLAVHMIVRLVEHPLNGHHRPVSPWITVAVCRGALRS